RSRPAQKKTAGKGLLIGAGIGGVIVLVGGVIGAMALMNRDDKGDGQASVTPPPSTNPLPISTTNTSTPSELAKGDSNKGGPGKTETTAAEPPGAFQPVLNTFANSTPIP